MPLLGMMATIWEKAPQDPEAMMNWPADYLLKMLKYLSIKAQIQQELSSNG